MIVVVFEVEILVSRGGCLAAAVTEFQGQKQTLAEVGLSPTVSCGGVDTLRLKQCGWWWYGVVVCGCCGGEGNSGDYVK